MEEVRGEVSPSRNLHGGGVECVDEGDVVGPLATCQKERGGEGESGAHREGCRTKGVVIGSLPLIWNILNEGRRVLKKDLGVFWVKMRYFIRISPLYSLDLLFGSYDSQLFKVYEFFTSPRHSDRNATDKIRIGFGQVG